MMGAFSLLVNLSQFANIPEIVNLLFPIYIICIYVSMKKNLYISLFVYMYPYICVDITYFLLILTVIHFIVNLNITTQYFTTVFEFTKWNF